MFRLFYVQYKLCFFPDDPFSLRSIALSLSILSMYQTLATLTCAREHEMESVRHLGENRRLITSWNNLMSALVWAPLSRTAEQARPSAGRFISVSLDKPAGHHSVGTHIQPDEAVLLFLHWKRTWGLNEHELSLPLPVLARRRCTVCFFFLFFFGFLCTSPESSAGRASCRRPL